MCTFVNFLYGGKNIIGTKLCLEAMNSQNVELKLEKKTKEGILSDKIIGVPTYPKNVL